MELDEEDRNPRLRQRAQDPLNPLRPVRFRADLDYDVGQVMGHLDTVDSALALERDGPGCGGMGYQRDSPAGALQTREVYPAPTPESTR